VRHSKYFIDSVEKYHKFAQNFLIAAIGMGIIGLIILIVFPSRFIGLGVICFGIILGLAAVMTRYEIGNDEIKIRLDEIIRKDWCMKIFKILFTILSILILNKSYAGNISFNCSKTFTDPGVEAPKINYLIDIDEDSKKVRFQFKKRVEHSKLEVDNKNFSFYLNFPQKGMKYEINRKDLSLRMSVIWRGNKEYMGAPGRCTKL